MKSTHKGSATSRQRSRGHVALHTETPTHTAVEDLYWFAMALTGDPDFAARVVAKAGKVTATGRGIFRD